MPHKRVAIVQSSYIPWKGYFDLIRAADEFILLDEVQFTKRDWRSRNRIKTKDGVAWLSVPVQTGGKYLQRIADVEVADPAWGPRHWQAIRTAYGRTPWFGAYAPRIEALYAAPGTTSLSRINHAFITAICGLVGIETPIRWSSEYTARDGRSERLLDLCVAAGATEYLSGPNARGYLDVGLFAGAGVAVRFADYGGYPEYPQPHPPFEHAVMAFDLLFCAVLLALDYMKDLCPAPSRA